MMDHMNTYSNGAPVTWSIRNHPSKGDLATTKHWEYHFFKNKSLEWWLRRSYIDHNNISDTLYNPKILEIVLPSAVESILKSGLINSSEAENILEMLKSPDKENLTIAIIAIIGYKKDQIKLNKFNKHGK